MAKLRVSYRQVLDLRKTCPVCAAPPGEWCRDRRDPELEARILHEARQRETPATNGRLF